MAKDSEGEYARILRRLIDDEDYWALPAPARLVWLTMLIAPEFKVLGIATADISVLMRRTGLTAIVCEKSLTVLESQDIIRRDGVWVWIRNHLRFQEGSEAWAKSSVTMRGVSKRLHNIPSSVRFLPEFIEMYAALGFNFDLPPRIKARMDAMKQGAPGGGTNRTPNPTPNRADTPETETPEPETPETHEPEPYTSVVAFYNAITGRALTPDTHRKFIEPRLSEGVKPTTLKLAVIGACLSAHHVGLNDRREIYLDPETIFRAGRLDGHADRGRNATFRLERGEEIWAFWGHRLGLKGPAVMEHFFRPRDLLLAEEGRRPIGPVAIYSTRFRPGDPWPAPETGAA